MSQRYFPFHALGFRCNPFRALTHDEWFEVALMPKPVEQILTRGFTHLQIIAAQGVGKTSALLAMMKYFTDQGLCTRYRYISPGQRGFRENLSDLDVLLLDEMQRLNNRHRARLIQRISTKSDTGLRLVCSSHEDLTPFFDAQDKPLQTVNIREHEAPFIRRLITRRLQFFSAGDEPEITFETHALHYLCDTFATDLRGLEDLLYEVLQRRREKGEITIEALRAVAAEFNLAAGQG